MAKSVEQLLAEARAVIAPRLEPRDAAAALAAGALLVDIRPLEQRAAHGEIDGAVVIDRNVFEWRLDPTSPWRHPAVVNHDQRVVVVCNEGYQSSLAAATLVALGFESATDVAGGVQAWRDAGLALVPAPGPTAPREASDPG